MSCSKLQMHLLLARNLFPCCICIRYWFKNERSMENKCSHRWVQFIVCWDISLVQCISIAPFWQPFSIQEYAIGGFFFSLAVISQPRIAALITYWFFNHKQNQSRFAHLFFYSLPISSYLLHFWVQTKYRLCYFV